MTIDEFAKEHPDLVTTIPMAYACCWTAELEVSYQPLREPKSRAGKVATGEQRKNMIYTAMAHPEWSQCGAALWQLVQAAGLRNPEPAT